MSSIEIKTSAQVLFENQFATIEYDANVDSLNLIYKANPRYEDFIVANEKFLEEFTKRDKFRFLVDARKMGVIGIDAQNYIIQKFIPSLMAHMKGKTLYHVQVVPQNEVFAKVAANNIKSKSEREVKGFVIRQFFIEAEAKEWLRQQL